MGARIIGAGAAAAAAGWVDVDISGAPDFDPNTISGAPTVHGSGEYTFSATDTIAATGIDESAVWLLDLGSGFRDDGTQSIAIRLEAIGAPSATAGFFVGMGRADTGGDLSAGGLGNSAVLYHNGSQRVATIQRTAITLVSGTAVVVGNGTIWPQFSDVEGPAGCVIRGDAGTTGTMSYHNGGNAATSGTLKIIVICGCWTAGAIGAVTQRVKLQYKIEELD